LEEYLEVVDLEAVDLEEVDLEAVNLEAVNLEAVDLEVVDQEAVDVMCTRCWDSISWLVNSKPWECDEVTLPWTLLWRTGWWRSIGKEAPLKPKLHSGVNLKS
jgi:hypothetical protein